MINISDYEMRCGAFAKILIDKVGKKALKLFKSYNHPDLDGTGKEDEGETKVNDFRRKVFETELEAYHRVQSSSLLRKHTPAFYNQIQTGEIINGDTNVTEHYLSNCCFEIEFIDGNHVKIGELQSNATLLKHLEQQFGFNLKNLITEFHSKGIEYTKDSSIIYNANQFILIDFATIDCEKFRPIIESGSDDPYDGIRLD
jgi:hypothetical protein